ncbi:MAG: hypothetical protein ACI8SE_000827 [Bacteroidia bacterium]|jgi:hypothetical protein
MKSFMHLILLLIAFIGLSNDVTQAQCSPTLKEIYDFKVGDQFFYRETRRTDDVRSYYGYSYENYEIVSKYISNDTIRYERLNHENKLDTILIIDSTNHPLNQCNGGRFQISSQCIYPDTNKAFAYITRDSTGRKYKMFGFPNSGGLNGPDSLGYFKFDLREFKSNSFECYAIYVEGLGLYANGTFFFEIGRFYDLQKFIRGADTISITLSNNELVTEFELSNIQVYPNPVANSFTINSPYLIHNITVGDFSGRIQKRQIGIPLQSDMIIHTSDLIPGVYYVTIKTEKGNVVKKLLKY